MEIWLKDPVLCIISLEIVGIACLAPVRTCHVCSAAGTVCLWDLIVISMFSFIVKNESNKSFQLSIRVAVSGVSELDACVRIVRNICLLCFGVGACELWVVVFLLPPIISNNSFFFRLRCHNGLQSEKALSSLKFAIVSLLVS